MYRSLDNRTVRHATRSITAFAQGLAFKISISVTPTSTPYRPQVPQFLDCTEPQTRPISRPLFAAPFLTVPHHNRGSDVAPNSRRETPRPGGFNCSRERLIQLARAGSPEFINMNARGRRAQALRAFPSERAAENRGKVVEPRGMAARLIARGRVAIAAESFSRLSRLIGKLRAPPRGLGAGPSGRGRARSRRRRGAAYLGTGPENPARLNCFRGCRGRERGDSDAAYLRAMLDSR